MSNRLTFVLVIGFLMVCLLVLSLAPPLALVLLIIFFFYVGKRLLTSHVEDIVYMDDTVIVKRSLFIQVFSCSLPSKLAELVILEWLVPFSLEVELSPHQPTLRIYLYSSTSEELRQRSALSSDLLRDFPNLKLLSSRPLHKLFAPVRMHAVEQHIYVSQHHQTYVFFHTLPLAKLKQAILRYRQTYSGKMTIILPFVSNETLKARHPRTPNQRVVASSVFRGAQLNYEVDPSGAEPASASDSPFAWQWRLRLPLATSPVLNTQEQGLNYFQELILFLRSAPFAQPTAQSPASAPQFSDEGS